MQDKTYQCIRYTDRNTEQECVIRPSREQLSIITSQMDQDQKIIACAGSGKTTTLVIRLLYLIDKGVRPESILVTTFNVEAGKNLRDRATEIIGCKSDKVKIGNIHKIACEFNKNINKNSENISVREYCQTLCDYLKTDKGQKMMEKYKYFFFDEFQDVDTLQYEIIMLFKKIKCNIVVIGDNNILPHLEVYQTKEEQGVMIIEKIIDLQNKYSLNDIAILSPVNKQLQHFEECLEKYNQNQSHQISYYRRKKEYQHYFETDGQNKEIKLTLSTLHNSKGLEWKIVFFIGINDTIIPKSFMKAEYDIKILEECRRMFYVGCTRAIDQLHLSVIRETHLNYPIVCRFFDEIDQKLYTKNESLTQEDFAKMEKKIISKRLKQETKIIKIIDSLEVQDLIEANMYLEDMKLLEKENIHQRTRIKHEFIKQNNLYPDITLFMELLIGRAFADESINKKSYSYEAANESLYQIYWSSEHAKVLKKHKSFFNDKNLQMKDIKSVEAMIELLEKKYFWDKNFKLEENEQLKLKEIYNKIKIFMDSNKKLEYKYLIHLKIEDKRSIEYFPENFDKSQYIDSYNKFSDFDLKHSEIQNEIYNLSKCGHLVHEIRKSLHRNDFEIFLNKDFPIDLIQNIKNFFDYQKSKYKQKFLEKQQFKNDYKDKKIYIKDLVKRKIIRVQKKEDVFGQYNQGEIFFMETIVKDEENILILIKVQFDNNVSISKEDKLEALAYASLIRKEKIKVDKIAFYYYIQGEMFTFDISKWNLGDQYYSFLEEKAKQKFEIDSKAYLVQLEEISKQQSQLNKVGQCKLSEVEKRNKENKKYVEQEIKEEKQIDQIDFQPKFQYDQYYIPMKDRQSGDIQQSQKAQFNAIQQNNENLYLAKIQEKQVLQSQENIEQNKNEFMNVKHFGNEEIVNQNQPSNKFKQLFLDELSDQTNDSQKSNLILDNTIEDIIHSQQYNYKQDIQPNKQRFKINVKDVNQGMSQRIEQNQQQYQMSQEDHFQNGEIQQINFGKLQKYRSNHHNNDNISSLKIKMDSQDDQYLVQNNQNSLQSEFNINYNQIRNYDQNQYLENSFTKNFNQEEVHLFNQQEQHSSSQQQNNINKYSSIKENFTITKMGEKTRYANLTLPEGIVHSAKNKHSLSKNSQKKKYKEIKNNNYYNFEDLLDYESKESNDLLEQGRQKLLIESNHKKNSNNLSVSQIQFTEQNQIKVNQQNQDELNKIQNIDSSENQEYYEVEQSFFNDKQDQKCQHDIHQLLKIISLDMKESQNGINQNNKSQLFYDKQDQKCEDDVLPLLKKIDIHMNESLIFKNEQSKQQEIIIPNDIDSYPNQMKPEQLQISVNQENKEQHISTQSLSLNGKRKFKQEIQSQKENDCYSLEHKLVKKQKSETKVKYQPQPQQFFLYFGYILWIITTYFYLFQQNNQAC